MGTPAAAEFAVRGVCGRDRGASVGYRVGRGTGGYASIGSHRSVGVEVKGTCIAESVVRDRRPSKEAGSR